MSPTKNVQNFFIQKLKANENDAVKWVKNCKAATRAIGVAVDYITAFNRKKCISR